MVRMGYGARAGAGGAFPVADKFAVLKEGFMANGAVVATNQVKQKVLGATAGSGAGAFIGVLVIWGLKSAGVHIPPEVESAITGLITLLLTGGAGWITPPGATETNIIEDGKTKSALPARAIATTPP
jgi:high-affinity Fe2+/Pb2+ permease